MHKKAQLLPKAKEWDIFLSYRRSEMTEKVALWLQSELEKEPIESTTGQRFHLDVFIDVTEPHSPDFQRNLTPILEHSRALIVLADAGAAQRKVCDDYLYQELDWWADNRSKTPFIVLQLDSESGKALLSDEKFRANRWDRVNCQDCFLSKWESQADGGATRKRALLARLRQSIRDFGQVVHHEEVERLKRRALIAGASAVIALIVGFFALSQMQKARQLARVATSRSLLFHSKEALAEPRLDSAILLAAHAVQLDPSFDQVAALQRALGFPSREFRFFRSGFKKRVSTLSSTPNGDLLAAASTDGSIMLFDFASGKWLGSLDGHTGDVYCLSFSQDGEKLASASDDKTVRVWDVRTRNLIGSPLSGHKSAVRSVAISPDGNTVAAGGSNDRDPRILLWDVVSGQKQGPALVGHKDGVNSLAFVQKGRGLISSSRDQPLISWDLEKRLPETASLKLPRRSQGVTLSPDGSLLACKNDDNILVYDFAMGKLLGELKGHKGSVLSVTFSPDGKLIASGGVDKTTILWDVATHQMIGSPLVGQGGAVESTTFGLRGKVVASSCADEYDDDIIVWNCDLLQPDAKPLSSMSDSVFCLAWAPDGTTLAYAGDAKEIRFWNVERACNDGCPLPGNNGFILSIAYSPDGKTLVSASSGRVLVFWDAVSREPLGEPVYAHEGIVWAVAFNRMGNLVASGGEDKTVKLWNPSTRTQVGAALTGEQGEVRGVGFSRDGNTLVSCGQDGKICQWSLDRMELRKKQESPGGRINCAAFSPDGRILATGGNDQRISLWDTATLQQLASVSTVERMTWSLGFRNDGKVLAAGGAPQGSITMWDVASRRQLGNTLHHDGLVWGVAFSSDGGFLASGIWNTNPSPKVLLWRQNCEGQRYLSEILNAQPAQLIQMARSMVARELRPNEVERYFEKSTMLYSPLTDGLASHY